MACRYLCMIFAFLLVSFAFTAPVWCISVSYSSGGGAGSASSSERLDLDDFTSLQEGVTLGLGSFSQSRQVSGSGKNSLKQSVTGDDFSLQNSIESQGSFSASTSTYASSSEASIAQGVAGTGSMSLDLNGIQGFAEAGQEASVAGGALASVQSLSVTAGVSAGQSTQMAGVAGYVGTGAFSEDRAMLATGTFSGAGLMQAQMSAVASEKMQPQASGQASLDGVTWLDGSTFQSVSEGERGICVQGLRDLPGGPGSVEVNAVNMGRESFGGLDKSNALAVENLGGGSYSSFVLNGRRWNQNNPQIQLYYNSAGQPSNLNKDSVKSSIAAAANTWDDAVAQNLFADTSLVLDTAATSNSNDGNNVHLFGSLPSGILGQTTTKYGGPTVNGYSSIYDSDVVYNKGVSWTTDLQTAVNNNHASPRIFDLQTASLHELGHTIGMGDLYSIDSSGNVKTTDLEQVMDAYDAPQRTLGNGDKAGAQVLYGGTSLYSAVGWLHGDFNGDGKTDLIELNGGDHLDVLLSNGDGTFQVNSYSPWSGYGTSLGQWQVLDLNGDGRSDLEHIWGGTSINSWLSNGDGTFQVKPYV